MEWRDEGIILGARRHAETSVILEVMTRAHGRHLGLVRGGRSRRNQVALQAGNGVAVRWRARLDEHLGTYEVEPVVHRAARLMQASWALYAFATLAALLRLLPERDPHARLYEALVVAADHLDDPLSAGALVVCFEFEILSELGYGLDLSECAATGRRDDLAYVSPRSGRAVSRDAGAAWADRLLPLPRFLAEGAVNEPPDISTVLDGFRLTGFFLDRHVYAPRGLVAPPERGRLIATLKASA